MADNRSALVVFDIAGRNCAVPAACVREVVHFAELAYPPGMPPVLEGFLNYAGEALPVVRLARLFDLIGKAPGLYAPMLVLRPAHGAIVLLVDAVRSVTTVPDSALQPVSDSSAFNGCLRAELSLRGEPVHLLALDRLLLEQERRRMAELRGMVEERLAALGCPA